MRTPTINEVRKFDREVMRQALRWKSEKQGEIADCLQYYLGNQSVSLWRLLDPVPEHHPDQGLERRDTTKKTEEPKGTKRTLPEDNEPKGDHGKKSQEKTGKKCWVCQKVHEPLCPLPEGYRKKQREERKAKKAAKAKTDKKSG